MLERTLGLRSATAMMVGIVIGSGIFASPGFVVAEVNSPGATLIVWALCGLMTACGAVSMAELSAAMPRSGGESVYLSRAFHPIVGFWYTWVTSMLAKPGGAALIALVFADYTCRLEWDCVANTTTVLPDTGGEVVCDITPEWVRKGVALGAVWALASLQTLSTKAAMLTQDVFTFEKLCLVAVLCIAGVVHATSATSSAADANTTANLRPENAFKNTATDVTDWALAVTNCLFAFNGWNNIFLSAGEVKDAATTIPLACMISLTVITFCYVWLNVSYLLTLPLEVISGAETIAVDFGKQIGGDAAGVAVSVGVAFSAFGALNGSLFGASRLVHACGNDGTLPPVFGTSLTVFGKQTPIVATCVQATIASILITAVGEFSTIVKIYIFAQWLFYLITMVGLIRLRFSEPNMPRPFRVPSIVPVVFILAASFVVGILLWQSPVESAFSFAVLLVGTPIYFVQQRRKFQQIQAVSETSPLFKSTSSSAPGHSWSG